MEKLRAMVSDLVETLLIFTTIGICVGVTISIAIFIIASAIKIMTLMF